MGPFHWKDNVIYDELRNVLCAAAAEKGDCAVQQDVAGFWLKDMTAAELGTFIYRCRQVLAKKRTGTGEPIAAGDRLYYIVAEDVVSRTQVGTIGTDSYFVGWAKEDADEDDDEVLMNFDGTRYDQLA